MTHRPADPPRISQSDLRPGDIILSAGKPTESEEYRILDEVILLLDKGDYTHSSLWDGQYVIEALITGVSINDSLALTLENQSLVDVYRVTLSGQTVGSDQLPSAPIIEAARKFKGWGYGYSKLVLAGIMLLSCDIPKNPLVQALVRELSEQILAKVETWLHADHSMICSEVVAQAYYTAISDPAHRYGLPVTLLQHRFENDPAKIAAPTGKAGAETDQGTQLALLRKELAQRFPSHYLNNMSELARAKTPTDIVAGSPALLSAFVTPGDLQRSPALELVGTLQQPAA